MTDYIEYAEPWTCNECGSEYRHAEQGIEVDVNSGTGTCLGCAGQEVG